MKRWLLIGASLTALGLVLVSWAIYSLLWTTGGAKWLLETIPRYTSLKIQTDKVEGRIAGKLTLEGLQIRWDGGRLEIRKLQTSLQIFNLLRGRIVFEAISAHLVSIETEPSPPKPIRLTLPEVGGLLGRLDLEVHALLLENLSYRGGEDPPLNIDKIEGRLAWERGALALNPLTAEWAGGRLEGSLGLSLAAPAVALDLRFFPKKPLLGSDRLQLNARLKKGRRPEQLAGPLTIQSLSGDGERILLHSELGIAPQRVSLRDIALREQGRGGTVKGLAAILFDRPDPDYQVDLHLNSLELSRELSFPARVTGVLRAEGNLKSYKGFFDLNNSVKTWQNLQLRGSLQGKTSGLDVRVDGGEWLEGRLKGLVVLDWEKDFAIRFALAGRQIRPGLVNPGWAGNISADLKGDLQWSKTGLSRGTLDAVLLESQFLGKELQGVIKADLREDRLSVEKAHFRGRGFDLSAHGVLHDQLKFDVRVSDLSALLPESRGAGTASGWVRMRDRKLGGSLSLKGKALSWKNIAAGTLAVEGKVSQESTDTLIDLRTRLNRGKWAGFSLDSANLEVQGTSARQEIRIGIQTPQGFIQAGLNGGVVNQRWQGNLNTLTAEIPRGKTFRLSAPAALRIGSDRIRFSTLELAGAAGELLRLEGDLGFQPFSGIVRGEWRRLDLARAGFWLEKQHPRGEASGLLEARLWGEDRLEITLRNELKGTFRAGRQTVEIDRGDMNLTWNGTGLRTAWDFSGWGGTRVWGEATSPEKGRFSLPETGRLNARWNGLRLETLKASVPKGLDLKGQLTGSIQGSWSRGPHFDLEGKVNLQDGAIAWGEENLELKAKIRQADLGVRWVDQNLRGNLAVELEGYGKTAGEFSLPLPADFPVKVDPAGPLRAALSGTFRESGLVSALFPKAVRSSRGKLQWDLSARGTWEKPELQGNLALTEGGTDLPALGLRLQDVSLKGNLSRDRIDIESLALRSGPGTLNGKALIQLKDWKVAGLDGRLTGKHFQFINRPHFQAQASPDLMISGAPNRLKIDGTIEIPEALVSEGPGRGVKKASPDVVIVDAPPAAPPGQPFPIQGQVRLSFGENVRVKASGLNTLLKGTIQVALQNSRDLYAEGEIRADQGTFQVQDIKLDITRGRVIFKGPPDNPGLDILALRTIRGSQRLEDYVDEVKAGVIVTGTIRSPLIRLYSQPSMTETDILSYIVVGKPMGKGANRQDLAILGKAAQVLLGGDKRSSLLSRLPLDDIDIQSEGGDFSRSIVTVGKYLDPKLYLGLGGSLFNNTYQVILRYTLTPRLELETKGGTQSGGGIYYKVDFW